MKQQMLWKLISTGRDTNSGGVKSVQTDTYFMAKQKIDFLFGVCLKGQ